MRRGKPVACALLVVLLGVLVAGSPAGAAQPECQVVNQVPMKISYNSNDYFDPLGTAIAAAEAGDTLQVIGTCHGNHLITKSLTITGRSSPQHDDTLIGDPSGAVLDVPFIAADVRVRLTVRQLTIAGGLLGIITRSAILNVVDTHVTGNVGAGGISNANSSTVTIENSVVSNNHSTVLGGGIHNSIGSGEMTIRNSVIRGNTTTGSGGGISNRGRLTIIGSVIEGNTASVNGGGIWVLSGTVDMIDSTVTGNTATLGGAAFVNPFGGTTLTVTGTSNLCGNTPDDWPGCTP